MAHTTTLDNPADYIVPLNINKLEGRMLYLPAKGVPKREILLIYGHHAMLERWWSLVQNLNDYGSVTMPDLPGFGGMDSFYKIGRKPTIDAYADYLAAFIKLRFKRKRLTIVGISFGFIVVTRMLQRYPELAGKVDLLVSLVGFMHQDDFVYGRAEQNFYKVMIRLFATRPVSLFIRYCMLNRHVLTLIHNTLPNSKLRLAEATPEKFSAEVDYDVKLWQINDCRTHWLTTYEFLTVDNCQVPIDLQIIHVVSKTELYFDNEIVKQHMLVVFKKYKRFTANSRTHTPSLLADKKAAGVLLPRGLRRLLAS